jgi:hypothetical protein
MSVFGRDEELNQALQTASQAVIHGLGRDIEALRRGDIDHLESLRRQWIPAIYSARINETLLKNLQLCAISVADKLKKARKRDYQELPGCVGEEIAMWAIERLTTQLAPPDRREDIQEAFDRGYWDTDFLILFEAGGEVELYHYEEGEKRMPAHVHGEVELSEWWKPFADTAVHPDLTN